MKPKILFVDDELNILEGLKRLLRGKRTDWEYYLTNNIAEVIAIVQNNSLDIIISDLLMPQCDGVQLLKKIKDISPHTVRFIVSGYSDEEKALLSTQVAHQFFSKPLNSELIISQIDQILQYRASMNNKQILEVINQINNLPSMPEICSELETELNKQEPSLKSIEKIISRDISITTQILHLVNSAFFGLQQRILRLDDAIRILGIATIKALIFYQYILGKKPENLSPSHYNQITTHSLQVASLSKEICIRKNYSKLADDAFMAGLLHDCGKLYLYSQLSTLYKSKYHNKAISEIDIEIENMIFNINHAQLGAYLLCLWGLPKEIVQFVEIHHDNLQIEQSSNPFFKIVNQVNKELKQPGDYHNSNSLPEEIN